MGKELPPPAYLKLARREIADWETLPRGYLARLGDLAMNPAARLTMRMVPKSVQNAATTAIEKTLILAVQAGGISINRRDIAAARKKNLGRKTAPGSQLRACDGLAQKFWSSHCKYAAAQGAATGFAGLAGVLADIPLTLSIAIREIRTIGLCYGFHPTGPDEIDYILHILRLASSSDPGVKTESLEILKHLETELAGTKGGAEKTARNFHVKYLITIQQYAKSLAIEMLRRNALQIIPMAGVVAGASFNAAYANDVGRTAYMCFRRRFLFNLENHEKKPKPRGGKS